MPLIEVTIEKTNGEQYTIDINPIHILEVRDNPKEGPNQTLIFMSEGKNHSVMETREEIREMINTPPV